MGCDIHGWIEVKPQSANKWEIFCPINNFLEHRNYGMFGLLFGVRDVVNFEPIAASRGVPADVSIQAKAEMLKQDAIPYYKDEEAHLQSWISYKEIHRNDPHRNPDAAHSHSWITYGEINEIDWSNIRSRIKLLHIYEKVDNDLIYAGYVPHINDLYGLTNEQNISLKELGMLDTGDKIYSFEYARAADVLGVEWKSLVQQMRELAFHNRSENVRIVVWFDN